MFSEFRSEFMGLVDYSQAYEKQKNIWERVLQNNSYSVILGLEHPEVITLGRRATEAEVFNKTASIVQSTRGGLATLHSEGQLVIYPILHVRSYFCGVRNYVTELLLVTQTVLEKYYSIQSTIDESNAGLYTAEGKIAFCGIEIKSGVSLHGLSINLNNDLGLFQQIRPCGFQKLKLDRVCYYHTNVQSSDFFQKWITEFKHRLSQLNPQLNQRLNQRLNQQFNP